MRLERRLKQILKDLVRVSREVTCPEELGVRCWWCRERGKGFAGWSGNQQNQIRGTGKMTYCESLGKGSLGLKSDWWR